MAEAFFSSPLRGFLLLIGTGVIVGVYLISRYASKRFSMNRLKTDVSSTSDARGTASSARESPPPIEPGSGNDTEPNRFSRVSVSPPRTPADRQGGKRVLVLHVRAKGGRKFSGDDILRVAEEANLERASGSTGGFFEYFGTQRERVDQGIDESRPLFYVANMFSPGVFDFRRMDSFSTNGLSLFAELPGAVPPREIFDQLLEHARLFADGLQGSILDADHNEVTDETIRSIKDAL